MGMRMGMGTPAGCVGSASRLSRLVCKRTLSQAQWMRDHMTLLAAWGPSRARNPWGPSLRSA